MNKDLFVSFAKSKKQNNKNTIYNNMWRRTPDEALKYLNQKQKHIVITSSWRDLTSAEHKRCFTIANVTNANVLQCVLDNLIKAKKEGLPMKEFKNNVRTELDQKGWLYDPKTKTDTLPLYRLTTIYNTNMGVAYAQGRWEQQSATAELTKNIYWQYKQFQRKTKRHDHEKWHNKVFRYDDPIWNSIYPPSAFNCACHVVELDEELVKQNGLKVDSGSNYKPVNDEENPIQITSKYVPDYSIYDMKLAQELKMKLSERDNEFDKYDYTENVKDKDDIENSFIKRNYDKLNNTNKKIADNIEDINNLITYGNTDIESVDNLNDAFEKNIYKTNFNNVFYYGECYYDDELPQRCKDIIDGREYITFDIYSNLSLSRHNSYSKNLFNPYKTKEDKKRINFFYEFYINEGTNYIPNNKNDIIIKNNNKFKVFDNIKTGNTYLIRLHK